MSLTSMFLGLYEIYIVHKMGCILCLPKMQFCIVLRMSFTPALDGWPMGEKKKKMKRTGWKRGIYKL